MRSIEAPRRALPRALGRPWTVAACAFALRLALVFALDTPRLAASGDTWEWGAETACLARSLLEQGFYGDPWCRGTGPSSWLTPPFPALVASLLWIFGGVTPAMAIAFHAIQAALSALTCVLLAVLGRRLSLEREGALAAWLWALYPLAVWNASKTVWDTTAVACGLAAFLVVLAGPGGKRGAARSGLAFGALLFLNPAPLAVLPALLYWLWRRAGSAREAARHAGLFALLALAVCLPWMARNRAVLDTWALRPNFGVELRIGNHDGANGRPVPFRYHPSHVPAELELYRELGEAGYGRENTQRALGWIRAHPGGFLELCLRRARYFWLGELPSEDQRRAGEIEPVGDWNSWIKFSCFLGAALLAAGGLVVMRPAAGTRAFLILTLLCFGAPYYVTHVSERYRFPIDPVLLFLDACLVVWAAERLRRRPRAS